MQPGTAARTAGQNAYEPNFVPAIESHGLPKTYCQAARRRRRAKAGLVFWVQALRRATLA
jgi:hypothetical protein